MKLVSFDPLRTIGFPDTKQLKPQQMYEHAAELQQADWVLFPEYWQLNTLQYAWKTRVFPSEASYRIGHNKIEMTRAFMAVAPHNTPDTRITANTPAQAETLWHELPRPFVAKLPKSSQGEGVWLIETHSDWQQYLQRTDVLYVQEHLPIDRDLRIVVIGDKILAAYWRMQSPYSFHNNLARGGEADFSPVPPAALELVLQVSKALGINHAGFDVAMVGERPYLLELNRLFGNKGIEGGDAAINTAILQWLQTHLAAPWPLRSYPPLVVRDELKIPGHAMYGDWALPGRPLAYVDFHMIVLRCLKGRPGTLVPIEQICAKPADWAGSDDFSDLRFQQADPRFPCLIVRDMPNPCQLPYRMIDGRRRLEKLRREGQTQVPCFVLRYDEVEPFIFDCVLEQR